MKKRVFSAILVLILCLMLLPVGASAEDDASLDGPPILNALEIREENGAYWAEVQLDTSAVVRNTISMLSSFGKKDVYGGFELALSVDDGPWQSEEITRVGSGDRWSGAFRTGELSGLGTGSRVRAKARYYGKNNDGAAVYSAWTEPVSAVVRDAQGEGGGNGTGSREFNAHEWAKPELQLAESLGLIPKTLLDADLKLPVNRLEFAAVSVKVYEALSGEKAEMAWYNPFTDTSNEDVLKAYGVGITNGVSDTEFAPDQLLNREQAATMLTRVYKKLALQGWTLETDGQFTAAFRKLFTMPEPFADDASISSWAKDSVYFMNSKGVIKGIGNGLFAPRAVTEEEKASGYAQATREQAILIAVRMVQNLG